MTQHRDLAPFLFCALFALRPFCSAPFFPVPFLFCALFVAPLLSAPFLLRPNVLFRIRTAHILLILIELLISIVTHSCFLLMPYVSASSGIASAFHRSLNFFRSGFTIKTWLVFSFNISCHRLDMEACCLWRD